MHVLKGGHDVIPELRDQSGSARTRMRQPPENAVDIDGVEGSVKRHCYTARAPPSTTNRLRGKLAYGLKPPKQQTP
jgi:hypothetical protein